MKKSEEFTSPASFLKKQSHIITNNGVGQDYFQMTPNTRELQVKQMHRSHFHSEANSTKMIQDPYFDHHDLLDMYSEGKQKPNEEDTQNAKIKLLDQQRQPFESFYQSDQLSSQHQNSQTKSHKKFGLGQYTMSQKIIKRVSSNRGQQKFLFINSKKQKYNNNYLFLSDAQALAEEIKKYELSIDKLKQENLRLRSEKIKLSSTNQSMQLIQSRLELQALKKKIKQLETEKEMHITINQREENHSQNAPHPHYMAASCLEASSKTNEKEESPRRTIPTFRNSQKADGQIIELNGSRAINSPRSKLAVVVQQNQGPPQQNYRILQNMKSPYFLKKN